MKNGVYSLVFLFVSQLFVQAGWHELLQDNDFEQISSTAWTTAVLNGGNASSAGIVNLGNAHGGSWYAYVGDRDTNHFNANGVVQQSVLIPKGTTQVKLNFYLDITSQESTGFAFDTMNAYLLSGNVQAVNFHQWSNQDKDPNGNKTNYLLQSFTANIPAYAGQQLTLQFNGITDSSDSTTFRIDDVSLQAYLPDYTITASAGTGGSVSPSGSISAEYGQTLTFTATPSANYAVDQWYVDGISVVTNNSQILLGVDASRSVSVTFKKTAYDLNISSTHGSVQVAQENQGSVLPKAYTPNSKLALTPVPDPGYVFCGWSGNISGLAQPFHLFLDSDKSITANFIPQVTQMAMSTPVMTIQSDTSDPVFGFDVPTRSDWKYFVQVHRDGQKPYSYLTAFNGLGGTAHVTDKNTKYHSFSYYLVYAEPIPATPIMPFLSFPLTNDNQPELTAYNAKITAVFDNEGLPDTPDGGILLFTGQLITFGADRCMGLDANGSPVTSTSYTAYKQVGYKIDAAGSDVALPVDFNYDDEDPSTPGQRGTIWYDGHTGYDYGYDSGAHVIAAAGGMVSADSSFLHNDNYNQLIIEHTNGYRTLYLHMVWEKEFQAGDPIAEGQNIGHPSNLGADGTPSGPVHLHLTVEKLGTDSKWKEVDPYGLAAEDGSQVSPVLWKKQQP